MIVISFLTGICVSSLEVPRETEEAASGPAVLFVYILYTVCVKKANFLSIHVHKAVDRFADMAPRFDEITILCLLYHGMQTEM